MRQGLGDIDDADRRLIDGVESLRVHAGGSVEVQDFRREIVDISGIPEVSGTPVNHAVGGKESIRAVQTDDLLQVHASGKDACDIRCLIGLGERSHVAVRDRDLGEEGAAFKGAVSHILDGTEIHFAEESTAGERLLTEHREVTKVIRLKDNGTDACDSCERLIAYCLHGDTADHTRDIDIAVSAVRTDVILESGDLDIIIVTVRDYDVLVALLPSSLYREALHLGGADVALGPEVIVQVRRRLSDLQEGNRLYAPCRTDRLIGHRDAVEDIISHVLDVAEEAESPDGRAAGKRLVSDGIYRSGDKDRRQAVTSVKGEITDGLQAVGEVHGLEIGAAVEGVLADLSHVLTELDRGIIRALEGKFRDLGDLLAVDHIGEDDARIGARHIGDGVAAVDLL